MIDNRRWLSTLRERWFHSCFGSRRDLLVNRGTLIKLIQLKMKRLFLSRRAIIFKTVYFCSIDLCQNYLSPLLSFRPMILFLFTVTILSRSVPSTMHYFGRNASVICRVVTL